MWEILEAIENSGFAVWVRQAPTIFAYPTILALHAFGMAFLVGLTTMIALRILGFSADVPLAPMERFFKVIYISFWVNALSGLVLTSAQLTNFLTNPTFYIKMAAVLAAMVTVRRIRQTVFGSSNVEAGLITARARTLAVASMLLWAVAIVAGRLTAYSFYVAWRTIVAVLIAMILVLGARYIGAQALAGRRSARRVPVTPSAATK